MPTDFRNLLLIHLLDEKLNEKSGSVSPFLEGRILFAFI